jgi:hypothetical protein
MKSKLRSVKDHVSRHRFAYGLGAGLSVGIYLNRVALAQHTEFLKEHNLYDEFYAIGMED